MAIDLDLKDFYIYPSVYPYQTTFEVFIAFSYVL